MRLLAALLLALPSLAIAQVGVHPGQNLQAAVDALPDGGFAIVYGGTYEHVQITNKSIAIIGAAPFTIMPAAFNPGVRTSLFSPGAYVQQPSPLEVVGTGTQWIYLVNARFGPGSIGGMWNLPAPGIHCSGLAWLYVTDSIITGAEGFDSTGSIAGAPGVVARSTPVLLERCIVSAGPRASVSANWSVRGRPGIQAHGSLVVLIFALVQGGSGDVGLQWVRPSQVSGPCPCNWISGEGGDGGNAVEASAMFPILSVLQPGLGGVVNLWDGIQRIPWGQQPPGLPFVMR